MIPFLPETGGIPHCNVAFFLYVTTVVFVGDSVGAVNTYKGIAKLTFIVKIY